MEVKITEKTENQLLGRTELEASVTFEGATPSNMDVATELAKQLGVDVTLVVIKRISTQFGEQSAQCIAVAYKDEVARAKSEMMTKHLRKKAEEDKKKAEEEAAKKAEEEKAAQEAKEESAAEAETDTPAEEQSTESQPEETQEEEKPAEETNEEPAAEEEKTEESE